MNNIRGSNTFTQFFESPEGHVTLMETAREKLIHLRENLRILNDFCPSENVTATIRNQARLDTAVFESNLPTLELPKFEGDISTWEAFYEDFLSMVDKRPISDKMKHSYLRKALKGEAEELVQGYAITTLNYKLVLDVLKEHYGNKNITKIELLGALIEISRSSKYVPDLKNTLRKIVYFKTIKTIRGRYGT